MQNHTNGIYNYWENLDKKLKKVFLLVIALAGTYLAITLGYAFVHLFYFLSLTAGLGTYYFFMDDVEKWMQQHELKLVIGAIGCLSQGALGLVLGVYLGYYIELKFNLMAGKLDNMRQKVEPITSPVSSIIKSSGNIYNYVVQKYNEYLVSSCIDSDSDYDGDTTTNQLNTDSNNNLEIIAREQKSEQNATTELSRTNEQIIKLPAQSTLTWSQQLFNNQSMLDDNDDNLALSRATSCTII